MLPPRAPRPPLPRRDVAARALPLAAFITLFLFFGGSISPSDSEWEDELAGDVDPLFLLLRKSFTTCCSRLLAYACRLRGAYEPLPAVTSKNPFKLLCLFEAVAYNVVYSQLKKFPFA